MGHSKMCQSKAKKTRKHTGFWSTEREQPCFFNGLGSERTKNHLFFWFFWTSVSRDLKNQKTSGFWSTEREKPCFFNGLRFARSKNHWFSLFLGLRLIKNR